MRNLCLLTAVVLLSLAGCKVSSPGSIESSVVTQVKQKITVGGKDWTNPVPDSQTARRQGQQHFGHHCQICHGLDGQNTGVPFARQMSPPVPELTSADVQEYADGQLKWIIQNGISPSGMPSWKGILEEDEMWKIVCYLRHLPPKGSLGVPAVFKEEAEEHAGMEKQTGKKGAPQHHHQQR